MKYSKRKIRGGPPVRYLLLALWVLVIIKVLNNKFGLKDKIKGLNDKFFKNKKGVSKFKKETLEELKSEPVLFMQLPGDLEDLEPNEIDKMKESIKEQVARQVGIHADLIPDEAITFSKGSIIPMIDIGVIKKLNRDVKISKEKVKKAEKAIKDGEVKINIKGKTVKAVDLDETVKDKAKVKVEVNRSKVVEKLAKEGAIETLSEGDGSKDDDDSDEGEGECVGRFKEAQKQTKKSNEHEKYLKENKKAAKLNKVVADEIIKEELLKYYKKSPKEARKKDMDTTLKNNILKRIKESTGFDKRWENKKWVSKLIRNKINVYREELINKIHKKENEDSIFCEYDEGLGVPGSKDDGVLTKETIGCVNDKFDNDNDIDGFKYCCINKGDFSKEDKYAQQFIEDGILNIDTRKKDDLPCWLQEYGNILDENREVAEEKDKKKKDAREKSNQLIINQQQYYCSSDEDAEFTKDRGDKCSGEKCCAQGDKAYYKWASSPLRNAEKPQWYLDELARMKEGFHDPEYDCDERLEPEKGDEDSCAKGKCSDLHRRGEDWGAAECWDKPYTRSRFGRRDVHFCCDTEHDVLMLKGKDQGWPTG